jgi:hypothetical protein
MADAIDIHGTAFKLGSATLMARVEGKSGLPITREDIGSVQYSVYLLDDQDADLRTAMAGHTDVAVPVADALSNTLQTDPIWSVDSVGYNFRHTLDVSAAPAFAIAGRRYLVEFQLMPVVGQVILVRFRINVI